MLAIRVDLLCGRYTATAHNDRTRAEWPPHPARFLAACLAAWGDHSDSTERAVLDRIEDIVPSLSVSDAAHREVVTHYVPVNDTRIVREHDRQFTALQTALDTVRERPGDKRATKAWDKAVASAKTFSEKESSARGSEAQGTVRTAASLVPDDRSKQGRSFPTVIPDEPTVWFLWPDVTLDDYETATLDGLLARVARFGHSSSLVSCSIDPAPPEPTHVPSANGDLALRVGRAGVIDRWIAQYETDPDADSRVLVTGTARYRSLSARIEATRAPHPGPLLGGEWFVFERVGRTRLPSIRSLGFARAFKDALMSRAPVVTELLSGHTPRSGDDSAATPPTSRPHAALVPLPFVGHPHADGNVLGIATVLPTEVDPTEERELLRAIGNWEESLDEHPLEVRMPGGPVVLLRRAPGRPALTNLRRGTWCRPANEWISVTPVALDRVPGDMHCRDPRKRSDAFAAAERIIATSCERAGLPAPAEVTIVGGSPLAGAAPAGRFMPYRSAGGRLQRVLAHAALRFEAPVSGPVLIGAGRFFGYGLFRPLAADPHD